jgi:hypothetical protein
MENISVAYSSVIGRFSYMYISVFVLPGHAYTKVSLLCCVSRVQTRARVCVILSLACGS